MKGTVTTVMALTAAGVVLGALGDVDPATLTTMQRFAWQQGHPATQEINVLSGVTGSIAVDAVTPEGASVIVESGKIYLGWEPSVLGLHEIPMQVTASSPPPFENWTGPLIVNTRTFKVQVWVYPPGDGNFIKPGPDTHIGP